MVLGTIARKFAIAGFRRVAKRRVKSKVASRSLRFLESKPVRAITEPATTFLKPSPIGRAITRGLTRFAKAQRVRFFGTPTRRIVTTLGAGAILGSPKLRKKVGRAIKAEPLLLVSPLLVAGKKAGQVGEFLTDPALTPSDKVKKALAIGGIAGLAGAGLILGTKAIKTKLDEPKAPQLVSPIPTPAPIVTAPDKKVITTPPAILGTPIPTAAKPLAPVKRKRKIVKPIQPLQITVNPSTNILVQNVIR